MAEPSSTAEQAAVPSDHLGIESLEVSDQALLHLICLLQQTGYHFVAPTPATHARVLARRDSNARDVRDVFGWSLPFAPHLLPKEMIDCLRAGGMLADEASLHRSCVRVSTLHSDLYLHSAYPTQSDDSVFFGPDSYRFADLLHSELQRCPPPPKADIADVGSGAGVGAIVAAQCCPGANVLATDVNPKALRLARINAAAAGVSIRTLETSGLDAVAGGLDIVMLNPPYIIDDAGRAYRDGGGMHGDEMSLELSCQAMDRLKPKGRVILYTGSAIVSGEDRLAAALRREADKRGYTLRYREIDPDVFGEELSKPQYREVERIAVVAAILTAPA
jgi:methylase of polypeptide subunit release factors